MIKIEKNCNTFPKGEHYKSTAVKNFLEHIHNRKCCYCETQHIKGEIEHFRPQWAYDWLINDCENLLWACHDCNNLKNRKLPVLKKIAAEPDIVSICDKKEHVRMINPTRTPLKEWSIAFERSGKMSSDNELMQNTIDICKLNREDLTDKRFNVYKEFEDAIYYMKKFVDKDKQLKYVTEHLISPIIKDKQLNYIALRKFIVNKWLSEMMQQKYD